MTLDFAYELEDSYSELKRYGFQPKPLRTSAKNYSFPSNSELAYTAKNLDKISPIINTTGPCILTIAPFAKASSLMKPNAGSRWHQTAGNLCAVIPIAANAQQIYYSAIQATEEYLHPVYELTTYWFLSAAVTNSKPNLLKLSHASVCLFLRSQLQIINQNQRLKNKSLFAFYRDRANLNERLLKKLKSKPIDPLWDPINLAKRSTWVLSTLEGIPPSKELIQMRPNKNTFTKEQKLFETHPHLLLYWSWASLLQGEYTQWKRLSKLIEKPCSPKYLLHEYKKQNKYKEKTSKRK